LAHAQSGTSAKPAPVEVGVLVDERTFLPEVGDVEKIVDSAKNDTPNGFAIRSLFGNPSKTRLLIEKGIGRMSNTERLELVGQSDAPIIDSYIVLEFPNELAAEQAVRRISRQSSVRWVGVMASAQYSQSSPSDPLFSGILGTTPFSFQWGMPAISAPNAWSTIDGIAYVGIADNGILATHEDFTDAAFGNAFKPQFARNVIAQSSNVDEREDGASYAGHGTHVAGVVAARHDSVGSVGVCRACSLMVARISNQFQGLTEPNIIAGVTHLARAGAQVINLSLGNQGAMPSSNRCLTVFDPYCLALELAAQYRTVVVAASGNDITRPIQFPASDSRSFSVGGLQRNANNTLSMWSQNSAITYSSGLISPARLAASPSSDPQAETGSNANEFHSFVAPARDVLSSMYTNYSWNAEVRCGTTASFLPSIGYFASQSWPGFTNASTAPYSGKFGICTGTSMAAPHVTGAVALVRSANPLLDDAAVRSIMTTTANTSTISGQRIPNVNAAVQNALSGNGRLTPLFILFASANGNYFQTVAPQMASAAIIGGLLPRPGAGSVSYRSENSLGSLVTSFPSYGLPPMARPKPPEPLPNVTPRANMRVFTTPRDSSGAQLTPLYRMSYADASASGTLTRHYIAAGNAERNALSPSIWNLDGVEGYIYPSNIVQPAGTIRIVRGHDAANLRWAIYPESEIGAWQTRGFTSPTQFIGYAFAN
jgi:serine protease